MPVEGPDFKRAIQLAARLKGGPDATWKQQTKALAELRQERFAAAKDEAKLVISAADSIPAWQAAAWFIDAAANARLHDPAAARASLRKGDELAKENNTGLYLGVLKSWNDWAIATILRQQAAEQIGISQ
jgi:hypothetical protein